MIHTLPRLFVPLALAVSAYGQWSTDSLTQPRGDIAATSVGSLSLFAGGNQGFSVRDTVEIYDHTTSTWLTPAALSVPRASIGAASAGGRAFFAGGNDILNGFVYGAVDIYDAGSSTWSNEQLSVPRTFVGAAALDGKVYFAGGASQLAPALVASDVIDVYDTATDSWSTLNLSVPRAYVAVQAAGDKLLFAGGTNFSTFFDLVDVYDTSTQAWLPTMQLSVARAFQTGSGSTAAGDLAIFSGGAISGVPGFQVPSDAVDLYDASTNTWSSTTLANARGGIGACVVGNLFLLAGGTDGNQNFADVDIYDAASGQWSSADLSQARWGMGATSVAGRALFAGGFQGAAATSVVDIFDSLGNSYCTANPNSSGAPARIVATGSASLSQNNLTLTAAPVPDQPYLFYHGPIQGQFPFGDGFRCVFGFVTRIFPPGAASGNLAQRTVDLPVFAIVSPGTRYFQCWYRDPAAGGAGFNLSDGIEITFIP